MSTEPTVYVPQPVAQTPTVAAVPTVQAAPVVLPAQPLTVAYIPGPDGVQVAAYVPAPQPVEQPQQRPAPAVSPLLVNAVLGAGAFALTSLGLYLLGQFIEALVHLIHALVILAAVVCGAPVALQFLRALTGGSSQGGTVINARKVRIGRVVNRGGQ